MSRLYSSAFKCVLICESKQMGLARAHGKSACNGDLWSATNCQKLHAHFNALGFEFSWHLLHWSNLFWATRSFQNTQFSPNWTFLDIKKWDICQIAVNFTQITLNSELNRFRRKLCDFECACMGDFFNPTKMTSSLPNLYGPLQKSRWLIKIPAITPDNARPTTPIERQLWL